MLIYPACRRLSENESYIVNISSNIRNKIEAKSEETVDDFIPCIAFCIGRHSYLQSEITIVPTSVWGNSLKGSVFQQVMKNIILIQLKLQIVIISYYKYDGMENLNSSI